MYFLQKFLMALCIVSLQSAPNYQATAVLLVLCAFMIMHFYVQPYAFWALNKQGDVLILGTLSVFFFSVLFRADEYIQQRFPTSFTALIALFEITTLVLAAMYTLMEIRQMVRLRTLDTQARSLIKAGDSGDVRPIDELMESLVLQDQLPKVCNEWLRSYASEREKNMIKDLFKEMARQWLAQKKEDRSITSIEEVHFLGVTMADMLRIILRLSTPDRKALKKLLVSLNRSRFMTSFMDGTDAHHLCDWLVSCEDQGLTAEFQDLMTDMQAWYLSTSFEAVLREVELFQGCSDEFFADLQNALRAKVAEKGQLVVKKGELGNEMFFVNKGVLEICSDDFQTVFAELKDGNFFGEVAVLMENCPRSANVRAATFCNLYILTKEKFDGILEKFPDIKDRMMQEAQKRIEEIKVWNVWRHG